MNDSNRPKAIMGVVPSRRVMAAAVMAGTELQYCGVKSLRRYKEEGRKLLTANRYLVGLVNLHKPEAIVLLKPSAQKATSFNLQLISHIKGMADSHHCPLFCLSIKEIKTILTEDRCLKNQRHLAEFLAGKFPELGRYLPINSERVVRDKEKYYQPLFVAIGLVFSYLKLISKDYG